jgi:hypothetical protein
MALVHTHYEKIALRPMVDIDLLLRPEHLPAAEGLLMAAEGYSRIIPELTMRLGLPSSCLCSATRRADCRAAYFPFYGSARPAARPHGMVLSESGPLEPAGPGVWILSPTALLLHLCAHLWLHHSGGDLLNWYDVYLVLHKDCRPHRLGRAAGTGSRVRPAAAAAAHPARPGCRTGCAQSRKPCWPAWTS